MTNLSKHLSIINKIKSFVRKETNDSKNIESEVTKEVAYKIQHSSYELHNMKPDENIFTPPYLQIVDQLSVEDEMIFKSAAYHLTKIARRQKRNKKEIIEILKEKQKEFSNKDTRYHFISSCLKHL